MPSEKEIEAAAKAIQAVLDRHDNWGVTPYPMVAKAALEAAEKVRAEEDSAYLRSFAENALAILPSIQKEWQVPMNAVLSFLARGIVYMDKGAQTSIVEMLIACALGNYHTEETKRRSASIAYAVSGYFNTEQKKELDHFMKGKIKDGQKVNPDIALIMSILDAAHMTGEI